MKTKPVIYVGAASPAPKTAHPRRTTAFAILALASLLLLAGAAFWFIESGSSQRPPAAKPNSAESWKIDPSRLRSTLHAFPSEIRQLTRERPTQDPAQVESIAWQELAQLLSVDPTDLQTLLPRFAAMLLRSTSASTFDHSHAAFVLGDFAECSRLAPAAAIEALGMHPPNSSEAVRAYELAGWSALRRSDALGALRQFERGILLTDRSQNAIEWANQQWNIGEAYAALNQPIEASRHYQNALEEYMQAQGEEDRAVLALRTQLAGALQIQGRAVEAEREYRAVLTAREKLLGADHPDTWQSRNNLAAAFRAQGKLPEAEVEYRHNLTIKERLLGPEHPETLISRNNVAAVLYAERKYTEAERENRAVLETQRRVIGPEHTDTLRSQMNLANTLAALGRYDEAEQENRAVLTAQERTLGQDHPDIFRTCMNLAVACAYQRKNDEALTFARRAEQGTSTLLGKQNPSTQAAIALRERLEASLKSR